MLTARRRLEQASDKPVTSQLHATADLLDKQHNKQQEPCQPASRAHHAGAASSYAWADLGWYRHIDVHVWQLQTHNVSACCCC